MEGLSIARSAVTWALQAHVRLDNQQSVRDLRARVADIAPVLVVRARDPSGGRDCGGQFGLELEVLVGGLHSSGQLGEGDPAGDSVGVSVGDSVGVSVGVSVAGSLGGTEAGSDAGAVPVGAAAEGDGDGPPACWLLRSHHAATRMSTTSRAPRISGVLLRRSRTVI
jgi:hypothetical protein